MGRDHLSEVEGKGIYIHCIVIGIKLLKLGDNLADVGLGQFLDVGVLDDVGEDYNSRQRSSRK